MSTRKLTLRQVSSFDNIAFIAKLMLLFAWIVILSLPLFAAASGVRSKETPGEIALGMVFITAGFLLIIVMRRRRLCRMADAGTPVSARLYHASHYQFFMTLGFEYEWRGRNMRKMVQIPYGKATKFLESLEHVTLILDPEKPKRFVIGDLYTPDLIHNT